MIRLPGVRRGPTVTIVVDGTPVSAHAGETVAAALLVAGHRVLRLTPKRRLPRGLFCGMGVCFDCLVVVDDVPNTRACMTWVRDGMRVELQDGLGGSWPALA